MFTVGIVLAGAYNHTADFNSFLAGGNTPVAGIAVFLFAALLFPERF